MHRAGRGAGNDDVRDASGESSVFVLAVALALVLVVLWVMVAARCLLVLAASVARVAVVVADTAIDTFTLEIDNREEMASDKDLNVAATFLWHC